MIADIADKITRKLQKNEIINNDQYEICRFGLKQGILIMLNIASTVFIGIVLKAVWQSVLFMMFYIPLRSYAGGIHAKTSVRCYWYSVLWIIAILLVVKYVKFNFFTCVIPFLISCIIIQMLAPVEDVNKLLDDTERIVYRKRTVLVLMLEGTVLLIALILHLKQLPLCISSVFTLIALFLIVGKIKNKRINKSSIVH